MFGNNERDEYTPNGAGVQSEDTVIGSTIKIEGDLVSNGNIMVEGEVVGSLKTEKTLTVGYGAKVNADVKATNALISGDVNGNMAVTDKIELNETAVVNGDVQAGVIVIKAGAKFNGKCTMHDGKVSTESGEPASEDQD
jgi:cytoskeletal protein CcmA (bactofilin family)